MALLTIYEELALIGQVKAEALAETAKNDQGRGLSAGHDLQPFSLGILANLLCSCLRTH